MTYFLPYARSATTTEVFANNFTQDLAASGRELDLEANYVLPLNAGEKVSFGALYRLDAGHKAGSDDALGVVRWNRKF
jgi:hypothetical protein